MATPPADTNANCQAQKGFSMGLKGPSDSIVAGHGGVTVTPFTRVLDGAAAQKRREMQQAMKNALMATKVKEAEIKEERWKMREEAELESQQDVATRTAMETNGNVVMELDEEDK